MGESYKATDGDGNKGCRDDGKYVCKIRKNKVSSALTKNWILHALFVRVSSIHLLLTISSLCTSLDVIIGTCSQCETRSYLGHREWPSRTTIWNKEFARCFKNVPRGVGMWLVEGIGASWTEELRVFCHTPLRPLTFVAKIGNLCLVSPVFWKLSPV